MAERELKATLAEKRDGVGIITLNRPEKLNAINQDVMDDLYYLFDAYEEDPEVRVIVLTGGDGKAFCAGGDIEGEIQMDVVGSYHGGIEGNRLNTRIEKCRIPVIAAINGFCLGGGFEMALACDIRLASERARIGLTEVNMGVIPGSGGTQRLPRLIGPSRAKLLMMTGNHYKGEAALAMGLVDMVFPAEELLEAAVNMAKEMAAKPPLALEYVKWACRWISTARCCSNRPCSPTCTAPRIRRKRCRHSWRSVPRVRSRASRKRGSSAKGGKAATTSPPRRSPALRET